MRIDTGAEQRLNRTISTIDFANGIATDYYSIIFRTNSSINSMGLDNDADLKRLQEELKRERERKEKLEKEVREKVVGPLMSIFQ